MGEWVRREGRVIMTDDVKAVGVIGAGTMGNGIAQVVAASGIGVENRRHLSGGLR